MICSCQVILSILVKMDIPCGAHVQPGTFEYMAEVSRHKLDIAQKRWSYRLRVFVQHTTEHIRLLMMAEMLYLFEEVRFLRVFNRVWQWYPPNTRERCFSA